MQKVIGLDIGSYSIKAIEIINTFKTYEVVNFYETPIPHLDNVPLDAVVPICMEQLFAENAIVADRIITAMPGQFISSRILPFNFSDPRKIEGSVGVEIEDMVPFNMDDMITDHQILGTNSGQTMVLAVMTRKAFLRNFLDLLKRISIDPKLIDIDSLSFYNLSGHLDQGRSKTFAMIDIGHEKTSVCIVSEGVLKMARTINLGGRYISDFLARDFETDYIQAQALKHRVSRVLSAQMDDSDLSEEDKDVAQRLTLAMNAIVKELGRTFYAYKSWDKEPIERVYLSGGTAKMSGLCALLSEQLDTHVEMAELHRSDLKIATDLEDKIHLVPQSVAIGMRAVTNIKKHSQINLRRGEFAYVQNYEVLLKAGRIAFKVIAAAAILLGISYGIKYHLYMSQLDRIKTAYENIYRKEFGGKPSKKSFDQFRRQAEGNIKASLSSLDTALADFQLQNQGSPALIILEQLSEKIPKELVIDVNVFDFKTTSVGEGKLIFKAETDGFENQAKIIDALKEVPVLVDIEEKSSGSKPGTDGKKIEFTIQAKYQAPI